MTEFNWGYNCLTSGIHHGRPEPIWNLPLLQATAMYGDEGLKEIVVARIRNDATMYIEHMDSTQEFVDKLVAAADERFDALLTDKILEISNYYQSTPHQGDINRMIDLVKEDKLNPNYQPLHSHDSINMLCRILGQVAAYQAR